MDIMTKLEDLIGEPLEALFHNARELDPLELERILLRTVVRMRKRLIGKTVVPNVYQLRVSREDHRALDALLDEIHIQLAQSLRELVDQRKFGLVGSLAVTVVPDSSIGRGKAAVSARYVRDDANNVPFPAPVDAADGTSGQEKWVGQRQDDKLPEPIVSTAGSVCANAATRTTRPWRTGGAQGAAVCELELATPTGSTRIWLAGTGPVIVGGTRGDVRLGEGQAANTHLLLEMIGSRLSAVDLCSEAGTRINGECTRGRVDLKEGDRIGLVAGTEYLVGGCMDDQGRMAYSLSRVGSDERVRVVLTERPIVLGRPEERHRPDISVEDEGVSRKHVLLSIGSGSVFAEDAGSLNGTWIGGQRAGGQRRISAGDSLELGASRITVHA